MTDPDLDTRSTSPPGRESREDWRGGGIQPPGLGGDIENDRNGRVPSDDKKIRSRSRSPIMMKRGRKSFSPNREMRYARDGTNTTSREPHLERARLFVGNIEPNRTHRRDLTKLFSQYGEVLGVSVHKGYAFVQMDREKSANRAINGEDNQNYMGSRIHVEFSQAAIKAGAKFQRLPSSPSRDYDRPPPMHSDPIREEQERAREERLARILQMEREIAMLRSREGDPLESRRPPHTPEYSHNRRDSYHRSSPPPSLNGSGYQSSYSRDRDMPSYRSGDDGDRGGTGRSYYGRQASPGDLPSRDFPPRDLPSRDFSSRNLSSRGSSSEAGLYRDSYPSQMSSGGGSGGGYNRGSASVGYGSSGGGGPNSSLPPGWPSGGHEKSNLNRPPFINAGPWS